MNEQDEQDQKEEDYYWGGQMIDMRPEEEEVKQWCVQRREDRIQKKERYKQ